MESYGITDQKASGDVVNFVDTQGSPQVLTFSGDLVCRLGILSNIWRAVDSGKIKLAKLSLRREINPNTM